MKSDNEHEILRVAHQLVAEAKYDQALNLLATNGLASDPKLLTCGLSALAGLSRWDEMVRLAMPAIVSRNTGDLSSNEVGFVHAQLGNAFLRLGDLQSCETHLRAAIHVLRWEADSPIEALGPTRILATMYSNVGLWSSARHELVRAIGEADRVGAARESLGLRINLAVLKLKSSDWPDAHRVLSEAIDMCQLEPFPKQDILCRLLQGRLLLGTSSPHSAKAKLEEVLPKIRSTMLTREEAICLEYLGDCHLALHDPDSALRNYQDAMALAEATAPGGDLIPELCHRLAEAQVHLGEANLAILLCERGLRVAREISDRYEECATHRVLAMAHRAAGNPTKAYRVAAEGIELGRSYEIPYELARVLAWSGETRLQSKQKDDQMIGRLQLWEARAVFERIGLLNEVRQLDRILGFEEEETSPAAEKNHEVLAGIADLDRGALRFGIITCSPEMSEAVATIQSIAPSRIPVLITGPSGVGKELLAKALHQMSDRRRMPFVPVNCGAIATSLIESELFGHERGAFTGAVIAREGLFASAEKGTIFLDEIGELPASSQATLLRILETGELRRLGSDEMRSIDVRVVAATNADLEDMVERGRFRRDLYYRLEGVIVRVPALREREDDIRALFRFFFAEASSVYKKRLKVTEGVEPLLCAYSWPGNVRELRNEVSRAVAMAEDGAVLGRDAFLSKLKAKSASALRSARERGDASAEERTKIVEALRAHKGNKADAARSLGGMKRTTLLYKIDRLSIRPEEYLAEER